MFRAAFVGWLIGKLIVRLVQGVMRLVEGVAYFVGAAGGLVGGVEGAVLCDRVCYGGPNHPSERSQKTSAAKTHPALLTGQQHLAI